MVTNHAADRINARLVGAGLDPVKVATKADAIAAATSPYWRSVAVLMTTFDRSMGDPGDGVHDRDSNGNQLWAVIRDGRVVTFMFRRNTQPHDAAAFYVDKVLRMTP